MRLWNSAGAEHTVGHAYGTIANEIETIVNSFIEDKQFSDAYEDWCWAYIAMLEGPIMQKMKLPEIVRRNKKRQDLEFRLKIDYQSFLHGDHNRRLGLSFDSLHRCLDHPKMTKTWGVPGSDIAILRQALQVAEQQIRQD